MRPPGIVIQLDELEYLLPGLYPGVALAIEGKLPFQSLEERLHDGVAARTALAGERLDEPAILELPAKPARGVLAAPIRVNHESFSGSSLFTALSRASIARFPLMRGALAIIDLLYDVYSSSPKQGDGRPEWGDRAVWEELHRKDPFPFWLD